MNKVSELLAEKLNTESDDELVFVVVEAKRISLKNKSFLKTFFRILLGEEEEFIHGTVMNVFMAQIAVKDIKYLATLDWVERISLPRFAGLRS